MKIIVTGATSFIGTTLIKKLTKLGNTVYAIVRPTSKHRSTLEMSGVKIINVDMHDIYKLLAIKGFFDIDVWIQLAWDGVGSEGRSNLFIQKENFDNCVKALSVASELGCKKFIFSGSQAEYGLCSESTNENSMCSPVSEYGKTKLKFAEFAVPKCKSLGMQYCHLRIFSVYGPKDHQNSLVNQCIKQFSEGKCLELGECIQKWNYLYIDDCVDAIIALMLCDTCEGIYNIASDDTRPLKEFINEINMIYGNKGKCVYGVRMPNAEGITSLIPDINKLKLAVNWKAKVSFYEGIIKIRRPTI